MKNRSAQGTHGIVQPPAETMRDKKSDRRSAAHQGDPTLKFHEPAGGHDSRTEVARFETAQRLSTRHGEPRSSVQVHERKERRAPFKSGIVPPEVFG